MDELSGLDWTSSSNNSADKHPVMNTASFYPPLRPTPPLSGRSTPLSAQPSDKANNISSNVSGSSKASTPVNDSFANLVSFQTSQPTKILSLQQQQRILQEQKAKQEEDRKKQLHAHFGARNTQVWDRLGDGRATPGRITSPPTYTGTDEYGGQKLSNTINRPFTALGDAQNGLASQKPTADEDDLLAAFDASAPVDSSSNFPIPSGLSSRGSFPAINQSNGPITPALTSALQDLTGRDGTQIEDPDDGPFGLGSMARPTVSQPIPANNGADDDDVLGLLGRPVSEIPPPRAPEQRSPSPSAAQPSAPLDRAVAELVEMGFPADKSKDALAATDSGVDVQAAVGWLLNQAHEESRQKAPKRGDNRQARNPPEVSRSSRSPGAEAATPAWMQPNGRSGSASRRQDNGSPATGEKDPAKYATELGNNLLKTANSLWKVGAKKLNQTVSEFNSDSDSSQPKWMREAKVETKARKARQPNINDEDDNSRPQARTIEKQRQTPESAGSNITDEALALESGSGRPAPRKTTVRPIADPAVTRSSDSSRDQSPVLAAKQTREQIYPQPRFMQQADPRSKLSRQAVVEQTSQAYISPARRKKSTPRPPVPEPEPDLLFGDSTPATTPKPQTPHARPASPPRPRAQPPTPIPIRAPVPTRNIPALSPAALSTSTSHRLSGSAAFKRGDYASATSSYTSALLPLPPTHPLTIPLLTNRALTYLKTGDPKSAISDSSAALTLIGPSHGANETIDLGPGEGSKEMSLFWAKATTRKAEALEQLERWSDAAAAWRTCVEAGVGGTTSTQGRDRCEKAAAGITSTPQPTSLPRRPPAASAKPPPRPGPRLSALSKPPAEAVTRLRLANAEAARVDDEKFALADRVDERLGRWRAGKEGNLRALLGSLETVLWEGSGWKRVGLSELVVPGRVKVVYMRGIGVVHPDKLPTTATTEQKMISASVFSALNEAWDRFKRENGM
ncbi:Ubiquitin-associated/translation elongation factor EF1B, N-terminal, eukaryote [Lasallia pustulata]|uniref:Ubiquitin-associated/translation elongation factor EF1B, N-terminal, eukaryote n=1 Tax=Lasallia pustulata TaxID=136370 RepID=A0A1W5D425_9LECA|nr:Ubiquitin-associated/translation elongation factor EF1B, N-terminal, eukaryote [Lasallia pustulata]